MSCFPLKAVKTTVYPVPVQSMTGPDFDKSETIVDEKSPRDGVKPVRHIKKQGYGVCPVDTWVSNAAVAAARYPSPSAPYGYYAPTVFQSQHPAVTAAQMASWMSKVSMANVSASDSNFANPSDQLGLVNSRLLGKLEQLHLLNTAWEARELPSLFAMFNKRNLLSLPNGIRWLTGWTADSRGRSAITRTGMASKAFLDWLRNNQLGYSFGLLPTIGDTRDIHEELKKGLRSRNLRETATIVGKTAKTFRTNLYSGTGITGGHIIEDFSVLRVDGVRSTLVKPRFKSEAFGNFVTQTLGINGAAVIWEAIPFSWCVDWFLSVDNVIDNIWAQSQDEYRLEYWTSTKHQYERRVRYSYLQNIGGDQPSIVKQESDGGLLRCSFSDYNRNPRAQPSPMSGAHSRLTPKKVYLMALVALGFASKS